MAVERKLSVEKCAKEILENHVKEDIKVAFESEANKDSTNGSS